MHNGRNGLEDGRGVLDWTRSFIYTILSGWLNELRALPWLNDQLVRVVGIFVGFFSVDVFQNVHPWHPAPPSQLKPAARLRVLFRENVVLDQEYPGL